MCTTDLCREEKGQRVIMAKTTKSSGAGKSEGRD